MVVGAARGTTDSTPTKGRLVLDTVSDALRRRHRRLPDDQTGRRARQPRHLQHRLGFAFRDILENLLAGILLLFRAPFLTGDEVDIDGTRGTVREVNLRETLLRTYDGRRVLIPNATVYKNAIVVQTAYPAIRTEAVVGVAYGTDLATARELARRVLGALDLVLDDPAPQVLVGELGSSTIDLTLLWWSLPQQAVVLRARDAALQAVVGAYNAAGIEMPSEIAILDSSTRMREALSRNADA